MIKLRHGCIRANDRRTSEFPRISENRPRILPKNAARPGPRPAPARGISRPKDDAIRKKAVFELPSDLKYNKPDAKKSKQPGHHGRIFAIACVLRMNDNWDILPEQERIRATVSRLNQNSSKKFVKLPDNFTINRAASAPLTARWS
jgi:hypothetical protein